MSYTAFERLAADDGCAVCGRNKDLVEHDGLEKCRHCATTANVRRAGR
jgi:hypothetical protein